MTTENRFARLAGLAAILAAPLAIATSVLLALAVRFDFDAIGDPHTIIQFGASAAPLLHWSMICDVFGFYLLLAPLALLLRSHLRDRSPGLVDFMTFCGLAYVLIGAMGASMLAFAGPQLITSYAETTGAEREMANALFRMLTTAITDGLWNTLEFIVAGVWWCGTGILLRKERRAVGTVGVIIGASTLVCAAVTIAGLSRFAIVPQTVYLVLVPVWSALLGADVLRGKLSRPE